MKNQLREMLDDDNPAVVDLGEYNDFRKDGWPFCPQCEEDELQNPFVMTKDRIQTPTLRAFLEAGLKCLRCGWMSKNWKRNYQ